MIKVAVIGGGISGLAAAYELELARRRGVEVDWQLYEAGDRLGGIVETVRDGEFVLEQGPDAWVTEKPWARELAVELGLGGDLVFSNDATRKTYVYVDGELQAIPDGMRMMVPTDLAALEGSALFGAEAKAAYAKELERAEELKSEAPVEDESVASFVLRHFGTEVLQRLAAPVLSGIFGGDVGKLSVRAVMPAFVAMEREYGSLIVALRAKASNKSQAIFTSLRGGMGTLVDALVAQLPAERIHLRHPAISLKRESKRWCLRTAPLGEKGRVGVSKRHFNHVLMATPVDVTRKLLEPLDSVAAGLLPAEASSAILVTFVWDAEVRLPQGFGFLVPQNGKMRLLAATFVTQKFARRAPEGATVVRAFFGGAAAETLALVSDDEVTAMAFEELVKILGKLPEAGRVMVRRWPRSLPQYAVGHLVRVAELRERVVALGGLALLGNAYDGVGIPDLVKSARASARAIASVSAERFIAGLESLT